MRDARVIFEKVEREGFDVVPALPQGRHLNGDDGDAVKKVFAEATFFEQVFQRLAAGGDETDNFSGEQVAAQAFGGQPFEKGVELTLNMEWEMVNFFDHDSPALGAGENGGPA